jgi:hypothetical protein
VGKFPPVPESGTVNGDESPLWRISSVALLDPVAEGAKRTLRSQVPADGTLSPVQSSVLTMKSSRLVPVALTRFTSRGYPGVEFVTVTVWAELRVPRACEGKLRLTGAATGSGLQSSAGV